MQFWDNILNGIKGILPQNQNVAQIDPQVASQVVAGAAQNNSVPLSNVKMNGQQATVSQPQNQSQNPIVAGINEARQIEPKSTNTGFASKLNPQNWDDSTVQKVLMASKFLSGFGSTPYNSNAGFLGSLANGLANGNTAMNNQIANYNNYQQTKQLYDRYGLDSSTLSPAGNYNSFNPLEMIKIGVQENRNKINREIAAEKDKIQKLKLIIKAYEDNTMPADKVIAQLKLNGIDINALSESNNTKETNSKVDLNKAKAEDIRNPKPRTTITKREVHITSDNNYNNKGSGNGNGNNSLTPVKEHKTNAF